MSKVYCDECFYCPSGRRDKCLNPLDREIVFQKETPFTREKEWCEYKKCVEQNAKNDCKYFLDNEKAMKKPRMIIVEFCNHCSFRLEKRKNIYEKKSFKKTIIDVETEIECKLKGHYIGSYFETSENKMVKIPSYCPLDIYIKD